MANSKKALDENGVLYLWGKVKTYVATAIANIKLPSKTSHLTNDSGFITAKDVLIKDSRVLIGYETYPTYIAKGNSI